ncbi:MAG: flagellar hook-length control protein FliK [Parvularculaceae bacterium]
MIEALTIGAAEQRAGQARDARRDTDADASFSLALAVAALEGRASASLKAFGGAPAGSAATAIGNDARPRADGRTFVSATEGAASDVTSNGADSPDAPVAGAKSSQPPATSVHPGESRDQGPSERSVPAVAGMSASPASAVMTSPSRVAEAVVAREASAARVALDAQKALRAAAPKAPHPAQVEFAKLLARRLDSGATHFDIRLNPAELGRVEARLTVAEDGKATLALNFDNQAALDLFARDETALRAALTSAGFQSGAGDLAFTMERRDASAMASSGSVAAAGPSSSPAVDLLFLAPFSQGVIDLRV